MIDHPFRPYSATVNPALGEVCSFCGDYHDARRTTPGAALDQLGGMSLVSRPRTDAIAITKLRELADVFARQQLDESPASSTVDPVFAARDAGYRSGRNDGMRYAAKMLRALLETACVVLIGLMFLGCTADDPDHYTVSWSNPNVIDGARSYALTCGDVSAHPCPLATHSTAAAISDGEITWMAIVAIDADGNDLSGRSEIAAITIGDAGELVIQSGSDDGGLRTVATLAAVDDGWSGPVSWDLTAIAGVTTFQLDVRR